MQTKPTRKRPKPVRKPGKLTRPKLLECLAAHRVIAQHPHWEDWAPWWDDEEALTADLFDGQNREPRVDANALHEQAISTGHVHWRMKRPQFMSALLREFQPTLQLRSTTTTIPDGIRRNVTWASGLCHADALAQLTSIAQADLLLAIQEADGWEASGDFTAFRSYLDAKECAFFAEFDERALLERAECLARKFYKTHTEYLDAQWSGDHADTVAFLTARLRIKKGTTL